MTTPANMPIFETLKSRMTMLGVRQKTIAQNVANVSTPGFTPTDVNVAKFNKALQAGKTAASAQSGVAMAVTQSGHIAGASRAPLAAGVNLQHTPDSETTLDGNSVVVEEQMMKLAETRMEFETMVGLYNKSLSLLRLAAKSPGR